MFAHEFLDATHFSFFFVTPAAILLFALWIGFRNFIGPTALSTLYLFSAAIWAAYLVPLFEALLLVLLLLLYSIFYKLPFAFKWLGRLALPAVNQQWTIKTLFSATIIFYVLFLSLAFLLFSDGGRIDKLAWTTSSLGLHYLLSALSTLLLVFSFHYLELNKTRIFYITAGLFLVSGYVFGVKGAIISLGLLYISIVAKNGAGYKHISRIIGIAAAFLIATSLVFFGGLTEAGLLAFASRFFATLDGTFTILTTEMYREFTLPNSSFYYIFDVVTSRFYGVSQSVGSMIAEYSFMQYPRFGGPNDSIVNYFLLSDGIDKIGLFLLVMLLAFVAGSLEKAVKESFMTRASILIKLLIYPIYLMGPSFFQATGTAFLVLARDMVVIVPIIVVLALVKEVVNFEKHAR